jgi:hypothetical protein
VTNISNPYHTDFDPFTPEQMAAAWEYRRSLRPLFDRSTPPHKLAELERESVRRRSELARLVGAHRVGQCVAQTVIEDTRGTQRGRGA